MRELRKLSVAVAPVWNDERSVQKVLVEQGRLRGLTNRLGFTVTLGKTGCRAKRRKQRPVLIKRGSVRAGLFGAVLLARHLLSEPSLAATTRMDGDCQAGCARQWNLLTNWKPEDLPLC